VGKNQQKTLKPFQPLIGFSIEISGNIFSAELVQCGLTLVFAQTVLDLPNMSIIITRLLPKRVQRPRCNILTGPRACQMMDQVRQCAYFVGILSEDVKS